MFSALFITFGYHISSIRCDGYYFLFRCSFFSAATIQGRCWFHLETGG